MRDAIDNAEDVSVRLLNYRFDGSTFLNHVMISGIRDDMGEVIYYLGLQSVVASNSTGGNYQENDDQVNFDQAEISASDDSS
jgi:hypothetical protein